MICEQGVGQAEEQRPEEGVHQVLAHHDAQRLSVSVVGVALDRNGVCYCWKDRNGVCYCWNGTGCAIAVNCHLYNVMSH